MNIYLFILGFPIGSVVKNPPANAGMWVQFLGQEDSFEKEMATQSSILAWKIPLAVEPGGLQFIELDTTESLPQHTHTKRERDKQREGYSSFFHGLCGTKSY